MSGCSQQLARKQTIKMEVSNDSDEHKVADLFSGFRNLQRRQPAALARLVAGRMFGIELPAGRGPNVVNRALHRHANLTGQCHAARRAGVGAAQADDGRRHRHSHFHRYALPPGKGTTGQLGRVEVDAQAGAAGSASLANAHGRLTRQRHSSWPEARYFFSKGVIGSSVCQGSATTG